MLVKQQAVEGEARVTTVLFDNNYELLHDRIDIKAVSPITEKEYFVGGSTAPLDATGRTIHKIAGARKNTAADYRVTKVLFVIIADGEENASCEYTSDKVKAQIERQKSRYGWEFIFLGANIDAVQTAARFGIDRSRAQNYHADSEGSAVVYEAVACAVGDTGSVRSSFGRAKSSRTIGKKKLKPTTNGAETGARLAGETNAWSDCRRHYRFGLRMAQHQNERLPAVR
jgi:hypothetical protein